MTPSTATPARTPPKAESCVAVLAGFGAGEAEELTQALGALPDAVRFAGSAAEAVDLADAGDVAVLCLGAGLGGTAARDLLEELARRSSYRGLSIVLAAGEDLELFADLVSADRLYYMTPSPPSPPAVAGIVRSALERFRAAHAADGGRDESHNLSTHRVLQQIEGVARQASLEQVMTAAGEAAAELVVAEKAAVLAYDPASETLWQRGAGGAERRESAAAGLVSYVVRTGDAVVVDRLGDDPRYEAEADNESGPEDERFVAVPVADGARVWGVLVALRTAEQPAWSDGDQALLQLFADHLAPILGLFLRRRELEAEAHEEHGVFGRVAGRLFREEALEEYLQGYEGKGRPLQMVPGWTGGAYLLLLLILAAGLVFSLVGRVSEYARGPAVVYREGRTDVTATVAGNLVSVEVRPGERVEAGQLLARLYGVQEAAELERIRREFEIGLVQRLRDPADSTTERSLGALRAQKTLAERRLEERSVRAPHAGTVGDVRVQPGQHLTPGQSILTLDRPTARLGVVVLIGGQSRPLIRPGQSVRLEIDGYSYAYQHLKVKAVGEDAIGPTEARRFLGPGIGDAVQVQGSVVLVTADLPSATFESDGRRYDYHEGILGTAEIRVRDEPLLLALVPGLRALGSRGDGDE